MFTVQLLNPVSKAGLAQLPAKAYHIEEKPAHPDAILVRSFQMHDLAIPESLVVVGRAGVGVNNIPVKKLTELGIPVLNTPGANTNAVRELVIAGMLLASRHLCAAAEYVHGLQAENDAALETLIENNKKRFAGTELRGKTLGVVGLGNIGVQVANAAAGLGMQIQGYDPAITVERAWQLSSDVKQAKTLDDLFEASDYVTLHVPLVPETKGMISHEKIAKFKKGACLLNFSRHEIVSDAAVLEALNASQLRTFVTDFPSLSLKNHPAVVSLPHLGASTLEAEENCALMIVQAMRDFLERGVIAHSVNFPSIDLRSTNGAERLAMVHQNVPGMVARISTEFAKKNINIISLQNGSRDSIAYTLTDIEGIPAPDLLKALSAIEGMIRVRRVEKMHQGQNGL